MGARRVAAIALALAVLLVGLIAFVLLVGLGRSSASAGAGASETPNVSEAPARAGELPEVRLHPASRGRHIELLADLDDGAVVRLRPSGFAGNRTGTIRQCVVEDDVRCHEPFPVRFNQHGVADVQYQVHAAWDGPGGAVRCGPAIRCVIEVADGDIAAYVDTAFGGAAQADLRLALVDGVVLRAGRPIPVRINGHGPDGLRLAICRDLAVFPTHCTAVGPPIYRALGGPPTTATFELPAGLERACRDQPCTLTARWEGRLLRADALGIAVEQPTAIVRYDRRRLAAGVAVALVLLAAAAVCWRRTDWSPPRSASGAEIDDAVFADLDAEAAAHAPDGAGHPMAARARQ